MAKGLRTAAFAVASLLLLQAALANPGKGNGKGPPDGRGVGGGSGLANGHGHANEAAINKGESRSVLALLRCCYQRSAVPQQNACSALKRLAQFH